ncbi:MAG TPA: VTT domain-containing protein, partial [Xanthobacteraceae bacterium]|nr:VTT domain-containing protein [Xanthobacteraceae bacterium]
MTETIVEFLRRWGELSPTAAVVLALIFVACGLVPIPRTFVTLAAGVVYGMAAIPIIMPATTIGCVLAFLLARYLFAERLWDYVERRPKLTAIMNAVEAEGWRIVALCRLASPIPSMIQSAIFGLTRIPLWPYTWATFLFTIPQIILYAY